jgi:antirestriction protein
MTTPSIYAADLAAYNAGHLHGVWIEFVSGITADEVQFAIDAMLKASPVSDAEEWDIHDSEYFAGFKSHDTEQLCQVAELIHQYGEGPYRALSITLATITYLIALAALRIPILVATSPRLISARSI